MFSLETGYHEAIDSRSQKSVMVGAIRAMKPLFHGQRSMAQDSCVDTLLHGVSVFPPIDIKREMESVATELGELDVDDRRCAQ